MSTSPIALREHFYYQAWALPAEGDTAEEHLIAVGVLSLLESLDAAEAKIAAIDALHSPYFDGSRDYCVHDEELWPCTTHRILHLKELA